MGKKIRNLIGILLLVTAIAVTQIPVSDVEAVETSSASDFQMDGTTLVNTMARLRTCLFPIMLKR